MAGKIIVHGINRFVFGEAKITLLIDGTAQASVCKKQTTEIPITHSCVFSTLFGGTTPCNIQIKNGTEVEIQLDVVSGRMKPKILRQTVVVPGAPDADAGVDLGEKPKFQIKGARGRFLLVYEDKCIISTKAGIGSFITGNVSDGDKDIYYSDVIGIQYKKPGIQLGYLQLETSSAMMNNKKDNFFNENSFTFDQNVLVEVEQAAAFIKKKIDDLKKQKSAPSTTIVQTQTSAADELKKFKELLDIGAITQEEFDAKKKELLGL